MDPAARDDLVRRVALGERESYRALVEDLESEVRGFIAANTSSLELVEEVVQAAFVEAYHHLSAYELRGTFASWVKGFARNILRRELSARARQVSTDLETLDGLLATAAVADLDGEAEERRSNLDRIERCLQALSPRAQALARRRFAEQVPINRLAQQFKQTRAAIANALTRIRAGLRSCVEASGSGTDRLQAERP